METSMNTMEDWRKHGKIDQNERCTFPKPDTSQGRIKPSTQADQFFHPKVCICVHWPTLFRRSMKHSSSFTRTLACWTLKHRLFDRVFLTCCHKMSVEAVVGLKPGAIEMGMGQNPGT